MLVLVLVEMVVLVLGVVVAVVVVVVVVGLSVDVVVGVSVEVLGDSDCVTVSVPSVAGACDSVLVDDGLDVADVVDAGLVESSPPVSVTMA